MDEAELRQPTAKAANWWRIAQSEARQTVLRRLDLPESLSSVTWDQLDSAVRESIARETVGSSGRN